MIPYKNWYNMILLTYQLSNMKNKIISFKTFERLFDSFAPRKAAEFEFSGVIGNTRIAKKQIKKIALTLDLTSDSVQEALRKKSDCLVAFHAPDSLSKRNLWQDRIKKLADGKITLYKAHLRLNFCKEGVNHVLCSMCGFDAIPLTFLFEDKFTVVGGVYMITGTYSLQEILRKLKAISPPEIRVFNHKKNSRYHTILIASGSGFKKEFFETFRPDAIISGEVKHSTIYLAKEYGATLIEATHWATEDRPLKIISQTLEKELGIPVEYISLPLKMKTYQK